VQQPPFFIVGFQRSGTTMLRLMLNAHSRLAVPFESDFIPKYFRRLDRYGDLRNQANVARLLDDIAEEPFVRRGALIPDRQRVLEARPESYAALVDAIFGAFAHHHGKPRWGDKDPDNLQAMDVLWKLFPGCRFVHIVRDGRDVALSLRSIDWGSRNLPRVAQRWAHGVAQARRIGNVLGDRHYLEVRYESLVTSPADELQSICRFLGEPFEPQMLDYERDAQRWMPAASLAYHRSSVKRPNPDKVFEWRTRMASADRAIFDMEVGETLAAFGYERCTERRRIASGVRTAYYALFARW
jgi:hypothetical protein